MRRGWPMRRRASTPHRSTCAASPMCGSRSTSRSRTAPAADCASRPARYRRQKSLVMQDKEPLLAAAHADNAFFAALAGERPRARRFRQCARRAVPRAAVCLFRCLRRLRRNAVSEVAVAVVWRSAADCQRHRLLVDLRRQPAGDAVDEESRRPRTGLVQFAVRGQCRIRAGLPAGGRQAPGDGAAPRARAGAGAGSRSGRGHAVGAADPGVGNPRAACARRPN